MRTIINCGVFISFGSRAVNSVDRTVFQSVRRRHAAAKSAIKLVRLLENGNRHAEDFHCLDLPSKDFSRRLLQSAGLNTGRHIC